MGAFDGLDFIDFHGFAFEVFVVFEEAFEHFEGVLGEVVDGFHVLELGVVDEDGDDFVVWLSLVHHGHDADGSGFADAERGDFFRAENEDIEGVVVFGVGLGNESVVCGVVDGGGKDAVEAEHPG